jgi:predicted unusual protein kinase regulating ubiquinone biosynthesis (AarF/ABC1/UbiB family)
MWARLVVKKVLDLEREGVGLKKIKAAVNSIPPDLEKLYGQSKSEFLKCLGQIHEKGVVHNDFHPMNVMMNGQGQLVVIDFGCSGRVGNKIPMEKRSPWWRAELYSFEADQISLDKFFCMFQT